MHEADETASERRQPLLLVDACINFVLGLLLAAFPRPVVAFLGVPQTDQIFYPSLLGAVLIGIGLALTIEFFRRPRLPAGLGLLGAVTINLCGAVFVACWLLSRRLDIPARGYVFLGAIAFVLVLISAIELRSALRRCKGP